MFTGTADQTAYANETIALFEATAATGLPRGLANKVGTKHDEQDDGVIDPSTGKPQPGVDPMNPLIALYTAAWFNLHAPTPSRSKLTAGISWEALIYGSGSASICGGGDGAMANCTMLK